MNLISKTITIEFDNHAIGVLQYALERAIEDLHDEIESALDVKQRDAAMADLEVAQAIERLL